MYVTLCVFAVLFSDPGAIETTTQSPIAGASTAVDPAVVVAACQKMSQLEYYSYVDALGKRRDFASLSAVYQSSLPFHAYAAAVASERMPHDKAAAFCSEFTPLSPNWIAAFRALTSHPREAVIGYVTKLGASTDPYIRVQCYLLCTRAGWDDLLQEAGRDLNNQDPINLTNGFVIGETVAWHADVYIGTVAQKHKEAKKSD